MLAGAGGYVMGSRANEAKHTRALLQAQQDQMRAAEAASRKELERLALQALVEAQAQALEDASYVVDESDCPSALPASRVRRLNQYRQAPTAP